MSRVTHIGEGADTAEMLDDIVAEAKAGRLRGLMIVASIAEGSPWNDGEPCVVTHRSNEIDAYYEMLGAIEDLKWEALSMDRWPEDE